MVKTYKFSIFRKGMEFRVCGKDSIPFLQFKVWYYQNKTWLYDCPNSCLVEAKDGGGGVGKG